jgi:hypothetical protein
MSAQSLPSTIRQFFEDYARAFESIDGARIATFYHAPTVTMRGDGSIHCLQSREELQRFFQDVVDGYYRDGYRTGGLLSFDVQLIGGRSALATIDWQLLRADGTFFVSGDNPTTSCTSMDDGKYSSRRFMSDEQVLTRRRGRMSAIGPKRTSVAAPQMSAFGGNVLQNSTVHLGGGGL